MFPSTLVTALIALGSGCIIISIMIFHYFRERVSKHIRDNAVNIFSSEETASFLDAIEAEEVTSRMLRDFFDELLAIWKPRQRLQKLWIYFPSSGILFIITGLLGSLVDYENMIFDYVIFDYVVFTILTIAIILLILGGWELMMLGRKLLSQ